MLTFKNKLANSLGSIIYIIIMVLSRIDMKARIRVR